MGRLPDHLGIVAAALLAALSVRAAGPSGAEPIVFVLDGDPQGTLDGWRKGDDLYVSVKELAKVYGGQQRWRNVTGSVAWRLQGRTLEFKINSKKAELDDATLDLGLPVLPRSDGAFVPLRFLATPEFADFVGRDSELVGGQSLSVRHRPTVGSPKVSSSEGRTDIEIELGPDASPSTRREGAKELVLTFADAWAAKSESKAVGDGRVEAVLTTLSGHQTKVTVRLEKPDLVWKVSTSPSPRRVLVTITEPPREPSLSISLGPKPAPEPVKPSTAPPSVRAEPVEAPVKKPASGPTSSPRPAAKPAPAKVAAAPIPVAAPVPVPAAPAPRPVARPEPVEAPAEEEEPDPPSTLTPGHKKPLLVIDAGHGGKDSGAVGAGGLLEKDVNLKVALELAARIRRDGRFSVVMTRAKDVFIPLSERSRLANRKGADLFVSIHCNSARNKRMKGFEIYFMSEKASDPWAASVAKMENDVMRLEDAPPPESPAAAVLHDMARVEDLNESSALSGLLAKELRRKVKEKNRGVKQASFFVLRGTQSPSVLFEIGFITNADEARRLSTEAYRKEIVDSIHASILDYAKLKKWLR